MEAFYISLVAGRASLADIGLAPAGAAPAAPSDKPTSCQVEQQPQEYGLETSAEARAADGPHAADDAQQRQQLQRRTFKVTGRHVARERH